MTKRIILSLVLVAVLAGVGWGLSSASDQQASKTASTVAPRIIPVTATIATLVDSISTHRTFTGRVVAARTSDLSFELAGRLEALYVDQGHRVEAAQILGRLDVRKQQAQRAQLVAQREAAQAKLDEMLAGPRRQTVDAARANVEDLQAQLDLLGAQTRRREELLAKNVISRDEFDDADFNRRATQARLDAARHLLDELLEGTRKEQIDAQRATVQQLQASIEEVDVALSNGVLRAPYAGTVVSRLCDEGQVVMPGEPVLRLIEVASLEVHVGVTSETAALLDPDSMHSVLIGGRECSARVSAVLPELDPDTRTRKVILQLEDTCRHQPVHEQVARLTVAVRADVQGYWLPTNALVKGVRGLWSCYALVEPSATEIEQAGLANVDSDLKRVDRRDVEVLHVENDRALVRGTIEAGDRIVMQGTHRVVADQLVRAVAE